MSPSSRRRALWSLALAAAAALLAGCSLPSWLTRPFDRKARAQPIEATALTGEPLRRPLLERAVRRKQEELLAAARAEHEAAPDEPEALIRVGLRLADLGRYGEAVELYGRGLERAPDDPRLYRHRGHRLLTLRRLDEAVADLERAGGLVDGQPASAATADPDARLASEVHYYLGLARYLRGEDEPAAAALRRSRAVATTADDFVAASYWLYLSERRLGRALEAARVLEPIHADMRLLESRAYHRLLRLFGRQLRPADVLREARRRGGVEAATVTYGVASFYRLEGDAGRADELLRDLVSGPAWPAFGHLAAEAELARAPAAGASQAG